jgi:hypothetical protein
MVRVPNRNRNFEFRIEFRRNFDFDFEFDRNADVLEISNFEFEMRCELESNHGPSVYGEGHRAITLSRR